MKETALITGASAGLGVEFARLFAADGSDLVLVARRRERLEALAGEMKQRFGVNAHVLVSDLSKPDAPQQIVDELARLGLQVDVLVNNAGFGARGLFVDLPVERQLDIVRVNVLALTHLTRLLLPGMLGRRRGGVLNVASTAAFQPGPHVNVYYATKAYVLSFTEALAEEVRGRGVVVSCLAPGPTHTEFAEAAQMETTAVFRFAAVPAEPVVRAGYRGFRKGKVLVVPGLLNRVGAFSVRLTPRALVRRLTARLQR
jgi:short-subunit dehydrogenase